MYRLKNLTQYINLGYKGHHEARREGHAGTPGTPGAARREGRGRKLPAARASTTRPTHI